MGNSVFTLGKFWFPDTCPPDAKDSKCIRAMRLPPDQHFTVEILTTSKPRQSNDEKLIFKKSDFDLSMPVFEEKVNITLPKQIFKNGTFFARVILYPTGKRNLATHDFGQMVSYQVPVRYANLLGDKAEGKTVSHDKIAHFRSKIEFNVMTEEIDFPRNKIPGEVYRFMSMNSDNKSYKRMLYVSDLNFRTEELVEVDKEKKEVELLVRYRPIGIGKMRLMVNMERSLMGFQEMGFQEKDVDDIKGLIVDTEMYLLLMTFTVSAFHLLFDCLAFKNDVSYWRKRETMAGISIRTVAFQMISTYIISLHLFHEDTSILVAGPMAVSAVIETWKFVKATRLRKNEAGSETEEYDKEIMKKLSWVLIPLCIGGAVYSLFYVPHKSWYGWVLQSAVNGVYAFGFLFMLPQLFINYKLKSVAHLPWKAFMYKAFNTFIDDVFAFIIKMPTTHRIACFRDDIVFFCYLYQRYLYPIDKSRVNEFGFSGEEEDAVPESDAESDADSVDETGDSKKDEKHADEAPLLEETPVEQKKDQ